MIPSLLIPALLPLLLAGCGGDRDDEAACLSAPADSDWTAVEIAPLGERYQGLGAPRRVFRSAGSDNIYLQGEVRSRLSYLKPTWLQPEGEYCLASSQSPEDCTEGALFTPGRIDVSAGGAACLDNLTHMLMVVQGNGYRVAAISTTRRDMTWASYNRSAVGRAPALGEGDSLGDACASRGGRLALAGEGQLVVFDEEMQPEERLALRQPLSELHWLGDTGRLLGLSGNGSVWLIDPAAERSAILAPPDSTARLVLDEEGLRAFLLSPDGALVELRFDAQGLAGMRAVPLCAPVRDAAWDERHQALQAWVRTEEGHEVWLVQGEEVLFRQPLDEEPLVLVPPGRTGEIGLLFAAEPAEDGSEQQRARVWQLRDPATERAPMSMFVVTTLEQPFTNADMACTPAQDPRTNFQDYVEQLQANIPELASLEIPVAVGVTWEFLTKARECGLDGVLDELHEAGFTLGTMIHDAPCYSCTDQVVPGEAPEHCTEVHEDYRSPDDADACWPSNPNYCSRGDQACWEAFVGGKALDVDAALPGGSRFIFGADRHRLWGFEYIAHGYRRFPRADGSQGYDITFFQGSWIYPEITSTEDPRGKDSAPADPALLGTTWYLADVASWEEDSAFSELLYMPGSTVALSRLYDMELSDMSQGHVTDELSPITVTEEDARTVEAWLDRAMGRRGPRPGTFYFHLADLTGYSLLPQGQVHRTDQVALLAEMFARIDARYGPSGSGELVFAGPLEVREEVRALER